MSGSPEQCGYDATFVSEVAEYLKCVVCHLVLRKPIQIMKCGHRFCEPCFERMKEYSTHLNTDLCCPIDKETIDLNKVFEDTGMTRIIGNLKVKCFNNERGCAWTDDLRDLHIHEEQCQHKVIKDSDDIADVQQKEIDSGLLKELLKRMSKCEQALMEKEKDVASLKFNVHELKKCLNKKEEEVELLKLKNITVENEMRQNIEWKKRIERDIENLSLKHQLSARDLLEEKRMLENEQHANVDKIKDDLAENIHVCVKERENVKNQLNTSIEFNNSLINNKAIELRGEIMNINEKLKDEINELREEVNGVTTQLRDTGIKVAGISEYVNDTIAKVSEDKVSEDLSNKVTEESEDVKEKIAEVSEDLSSQITEISENMKLLNKSKGETMKKVEEVKRHIGNIENILFCDPSSGSKDIVLQWKLSNYQHHANTGKPIFSPIFLAQIKGYAFKLYVQWTGEKKETVGLYFTLCRGENYNGTLEPFDIAFSLQMVDNEGGERSRNIELSNIRNNREDCFTLHPGENESRNDWGFHTFLTKDEVENYVANDMLTIKCKLHHPE